MEPNRNDSPNNNKNPGDQKKPKSNLLFTIVVTLSIILLVTWVFNAV